MKRYFHGFNIYFALACLFFAAGCDTWSKAGRFAKQEQSTIRLYLEGSKADLSGTGTVLVTRERFPYTIERSPFVTEGDLIGAKMISEPGPDGGYSIELDFNDHGALVLDMLTTANKGRHIVIFSQFPKVGTKAPKQPKKPKNSDNMDLQMHEALPEAHPELEAEAGQPRSSAWLGAVLVRQRNPSGVFRFSPDATLEETKRIVRGLQNVVAYQRSIDNDKH